LHLEALGTKVEFGTELRAFTQSKDSVDVELVRCINDGQEVVEHANVPWLVGTDGAHSIIRKTLNFDFLGETREEHEMVIGDFRIASEPREVGLQLLTLYLIGLNIDFSFGSVGANQKQRCKYIDSLI
jgi:2-polyprenyl-6-methoxyphenol hydroxylase-like FAD-dependent oxidoreductase